MSCGFDWGFIWTGSGDGMRPIGSATATVGPLGLLNILETQLGLVRERPSQSERIVQYRDCLERCDRADRFFHRTFSTDELGTAATLLEWRDRWHLHGWTGFAVSMT